MKDSLRFIFLTRHGDLRSGWRMTMFAGLLVPAFGAAAFVGPLVGAGGEHGSAALGVLGVMAVTFVMTRWVNRKPLGAVGLFLNPRALRDTVLGLVIGIGMMSGIAGVQGLAGTLEISWSGMDFYGAAGAILSAFLMFALAGFLEELLFRGYLFQSLMQAVTFLPAAFMFAALFSAAHLGNPNTTTIGMINVGLAGLWLSFAYLKTRSLWLPTGLHVGWNFAQTTLFGYRTSGVDFEGMELFVQSQQGSEWFTGGMFGAEGSVLASVAIVLSTWYILKSDLFKAPEGVVTLDSIEDLLTAPRNGDPAA